jgi:hypothetical protein
MKTILVVLSAAAAMLLFLIIFALLRIKSLPPATPPYQSSPVTNNAAPNMPQQPDGHAVRTPQGSAGSASVLIDSALQPTLAPTTPTLAPTDKDAFWSTIDSNNALADSRDSIESSDSGISWSEDLEVDLNVAAPTQTAESLAPSPQPPAPSKDPDLQLGLEQTSKSSTSLRNADYPNTYISRIDVDLTSPNHWVRLTWSGPDASSQETGPFHSSPGRGLGNNNCDDVNESNRQNSNCTPKGTMHVQGFSEDMRTCRHCKFVTWFNIRREVAFHYYPDVPNYPASHGCVRLEDMHAAQLIHNNSKIGATEVVVDGTWTFGY